MKSALKVAEAEFPLAYLRPEFAQTYRWRERRASEWEGLVEQRCLTMFSSQSVEHLRERFSGLESERRADLKAGPNRLNGIWSICGGHTESLAST